jgi:hypothetical protein
MYSELDCKILHYFVHFYFEGFSMPHLKFLMNHFQNERGHSDFQTLFMNILKLYFKLIETV